ncbi:MAG: hypothetical protein AB2606_07295 [Candidatus Thiodiazotropha taylori]
MNAKALDIALRFTKDNNVKINSAHAIVRSYLTNRDNCAADYLCSESVKKRNEAEYLVNDSLEFCAENNIPFLVLHLGQLESDEIIFAEKKVLESKHIAPLGLMKLRERYGKEHVYRLVETINHWAEIYPNTKIAIENRNRISQVPMLNELQFILQHTKSSHVGHWHDMAHARAFERLTGIKRSLWWSKIGARVWGNHVQDSKFDYSEHLPLSFGDDQIDKNSLGKTQFWVLEVSSEHPESKLKKSISILNDMRYSLC